MINKLNEYNKLSKSEILTEIINYITSQLEIIERKEISEEAFQNPQWDNYQAFLLGQKKLALKLLEFIPDPEKT